MKNNFHRIVILVALSSASLNVPALDETLDESCRAQATLEKIPDSQLDAYMQACISNHSLAEGGNKDEEGQGRGSDHPDDPGAGTEDLDTDGSRSDQQREAIDQ